jgi:hypothetical protein
VEKPHRRRRLRRYCRQLDWFEFIVDGTHFHRPSVIAGFLQPQLARFHCSDSAIKELSISTKDGGEEFGNSLNVVTDESTCPFHFHALCVGTIFYHFEREMVISNSVSNEQAFIEGIVIHGGIRTLWITS